jgi:hypothetical protein
MCAKPMYSMYSLKVKVTIQVQMSVKVLSIIPLPLKERLIVFKLC